MAEVAPLRGLRYDSRKIAHLDEVVIPPYDVISPEEQVFYHDLNGHNMIRLELGMARADDNESDNPHTRAAQTLKAWQHEEILKRDPGPAIYYYELDYPLEREKRTRRGFICLLKLEDFSSGRVRPHEKTFAKVKDERLALMLQCHANLSSIYALYGDADGRIDRLFVEAIGEMPPAENFTDRHQMSHKLWPLTDPALLSRLRAAMKEKEIFIADGHHRYETALNYRNLMRRKYPQAGPTASFEYVMMYLASMDQEGLSILPTHRLLRSHPEWDEEELIREVRPFFEVRAFDADEEGRQAWEAALLARGERKQTAFGLYVKDLKHFYLLDALHEPIDKALATIGVPDVLRRLDVVILDKILLQRILGLSKEHLSDNRNIRFHHSLAGALEEIRSSTGEWAFFINPTRMEQVREVAGSGLTMPHKATYFYPKVISGLVINLLDPAEHVS